MSNQFGMYSEQYNNDYSKEQNQQFTAAFDAITQQFLAFMKEGLPASAETVQQAVRAHYEFTSQFWRPTREAYKNLALSYIMPSPYRDSYEGIAEGLGKYHYDAIVIWADKNL
jgi:hypothetical protein